MSEVGSFREDLYYRLNVKDSHRVAPRVSAGRLPLLMND